MNEHIYHTLTGEIHYWTYHEPEPQTPSDLWLVFLPGLTADHRMFDQQIAVFQKNYPCLVWDAPAHGASRPFTLHFSIEDLAKYLHDILENEQIKRFVLIGQSMGGFVAQMYEWLYPGTAAGIISVDSSSLQKAYYANWELFSLKHTEGMYKSIPWNLLVKLSGTGNAQTTYGQKLMQSMMLDYEKSEFCHLSGYGFRILAEAIEEDQDYTITCPILLLCGDKDQAGFIKRYNKAWTKHSGYPLVWIKNAGHISNVDNPEAVNAQIEHFLKFIEI